MRYDQCEMFINHFLFLLSMIFTPIPLESLALVYMCSMLFFSDTTFSSVYPIFHLPGSASPLRTRTLFARARIDARDPSLSALFCYFWRLDCPLPASDYRSGVLSFPNVMIPPRLPTRSLQGCRSAQRLLDFGSGRLRPGKA